MEENQLQFQQDKLTNSRKRVFKLIAVFSSISLVVFLMLAFTIPFQDTIFQVLFPRDQSGAATAPTISLFKSTQTTDQVNVVVSVDPAGIEVTAVDISLNFDTSKLRLTAVNTGTGHTLTQYAPINSSDLFDATQVITNANSTGTILFGAISYDLSSGEVGAPMNTAFTLATLTFSIIDSTGTTTININHTPGAENDSNIIVLNSTDDALQQINNLTISFTGNVNPTPPPNPSCEGDLNGDRVVNVFDLGMFTGCYGKATSDTSVTYVSQCDLITDDSNSINVFDLGKFASFYGSSCN